MSMSTGRWRIVICLAGEEPREVPRSWLYPTYYRARVTAAKILEARTLAYSLFTAHVAHEKDDPAWHRAETLRGQLFCPINMSWLLQLEYQDGADCPSDLFLVPRPPGMCWKCDRRLERGGRILCPECKRYRDRCYNTWWRRHRRLERRERATVN